MRLGRLPPRDTWAIFHGGKAGCFKPPVFRKYQIVPPTPAPTTASTMAYLSQVGKPGASSVPMLASARSTSPRTSGPPVEATAPATSRKPEAQEVKFDSLVIACVIVSSPSRLATFCRATAMLTLFGGAPSRARARMIASWSATTRAWAKMRMVVRRLPSSESNLLGWR